MNNLLANENNTKQRISKKIYYIKAEKLIREANDNFIYFKDYEMALEQIEEALQLDPENAGAFLLKGNIFFCLDEMDTAYECFEEALQINPSSAEAHSFKANILDINDSPKEALEACNKAFKSLRPKDNELMTALYDQKIAIQLKLKRFEDAKQTLKESFKYLNEEDCSYIASCYRDAIDSSHKEKQKRKTCSKKTQVSS